MNYYESWERFSVTGANDISHDILAYVTRRKYFGLSEPKVADIYVVRGKKKRLIIENLDIDAYYDDPGIRGLISRRLYEHIDENYNPPVWGLTTGCAR